MSKSVLVTGATGYLGSWLVMRLLEKGYKVKAAVVSKDDKKDLEPLLNLSPTLAENLEIVEGDMLQDGALDCHVEGCEGVFHLAFNVLLHAEDLQKAMMEPAVQGSLNVLKSCAKSSTVKRVVYVSSCAAALNCNPTQEILDESCWTDADAIKKWNGWQYAVAKMLGEQAAAEFAKENNLDLVIINPAFVLGPYLLNRIPASTAEMKPYLTGECSPFGFSRFSVPGVHTEDLARALIFLYQTKEATGRHMCGNGGISGVEFRNKVIEHLNKELNLKFEESNAEDGHVRGLDSSKLKSLGFQFNYNVNDMINDFITCTKEKGIDLHRLLQVA